MANDPTKTLTLRTKAVKEVEKRFNALRRLVLETVVKNKYFVNITNAESLKKPIFEYRTDREKINDFRIWLNEAINEVIFDGMGPDDAQLLWLNDYIKQAYGRGVSFTESSLASSIPNVGIGVTTLQVGDNFIQTALKLTKTQRLLLPAHVDRTREIYSRVYTDLRGVTDKMAAEITKHLTDGLFAGLNPNKIGENMAKSIESIGIVRGRLIARTEIVRAYQIGVVQQGEIFADDYGWTMMYRWRTNVDGRERESHRRRNGNLYTKQQVLPLTGEPNCRCTVQAEIIEG